MGPVRRFRSGAQSAQPAEAQPSASAAEPPEQPAPEPAAPEPAARSGPSVRRTALELAGRIEEILETAERFALEIQQEAEASAQRYLDERRRETDRELEERLRDGDRGLEERVLAAARIGSSLRHEAERVLEQISVLERTADEALAALGHSGESQASGVPEAGQGATVEEIREPRRPVPEEALLRAAQMAVGGSSRDEIERALTAEFRITAPGAVVDEILDR